MKSLLVLNMILTFTLGIYVYDTSVNTRLLRQEVSRLQQVGPTESDVAATSNSANPELWMVDRRELKQLITEAMAPYGRLDSDEQVVSSSNAPAAPQEDPNSDLYHFEADQQMQELLSAGQVESRQLQSFYMSISRLKAEDQRQYYRQLSEAVMSGKIQLLQ